MRHILALTLILLGFGGAAVPQALSVANADSHHAAVIEIDGAIQAMTARFISRSITKAEADGAELLLILLDTPGGLLSATRDIVEAMLASEVPLVVYVSPPGAEATSAGTFVAAAAHVAAMAPGTNIGAAAPVGGGGEDLPKALAAKATQAAAAFVRSIAEERGRNADALESTVLGPTAYAASAALEQNMIDLIARDVDALLEVLDGTEVRLDPQVTVRLRTGDIDLRRIERTPVERFVGFLADPNIAFVLMSLGTLGIFVELMSPGLLVPGIAGGIALALAFVAAGNLPVNWAGVALLVFALLLFFLEVQAPGIGVFGIAGAVAFALGAFLLFGGISAPPIATPSFRVNIWLIAGAAATMLAFATFVLRDMAAARRLAYSNRAAGPSLVDQTATATTDLTPGGSVHAGGEEWSAVSDSGEPIRKGDQVVVLEIEGLTLKVFPSEEVEAYPDSNLEHPDSGDTRDTRTEGG